MLNSGIYCQRYSKGRDRMQKKVIITGITFLLLLFTGSLAYAIPSTYVVQAGDTLWKISQTNGVSINSIKQLNGLNSEQLNIGQTLTLVGSPINPSAPVTVTPVQDNTTVYVVAAGDSLWTIASKYGTSVASIKELNGLSSDILQTGDSIKVSVAVAPVPSRSGDRVDVSRLLADAAQYLGTPYRYGGSGPGGFDCSGFTSYIFKRAGITLPRTAAGQYSIGMAIDKANLMAGDLVLFSCGGGGINHVGIYSDGGRFIHSSSPSSGGVIYSNLNDSYYSRSYVGARRVLR